MIWNWKPLFILIFDNMSAQNRITLVSEEYWSGCGNILYASLPPLAITLIWHFLYPYIARGLIWYHDKQALNTSKMRDDLVNKEENQSELERL